MMNQDLTVAESRYATHPSEYLAMDVTALRERFVEGGLFESGKFRMVYSHEDRMVFGGVCPRSGSPLALQPIDQLRSTYFCERRELAVMNIGDEGTVTVDGVEHKLGHRDCLYIGRGNREIVFSSDTDRSRFFLVSATSHKPRGVEAVPASAAMQNDAGDQKTANRRRVAKYIHADGTQSDQLVMGITTLAEGSVWNSMPPHLHARRTEAYLYFDVDEGSRVFHFMGQPGEPRVIPMSNEELVISPAWSMHFGSGTSAYAFIWVMAGENQVFEDMDQVSVPEI